MNGHAPGSPEWQRLITASGRPTHTARTASMSRTASIVCDECQREMGEDDGALCAWCISLLWQQRGAEWWSE